MKTNKPYFLVPQNEGQDLNYVETFHGNKKEAVNRAVQMHKQLVVALKQGMISVEVRDWEFNRVMTIS